MQQKGKSLTFVKLLEEYDMSFDITDTNTPYVKVNFWKNNNPEEKEMWSFDRFNHEDFWGMLIDLVIEKRYTTNYSGIFKKETK
jgi:hypothetical protein